MLHLDLLNVRSLCDFKFMVSKPWKVGGDWMVRMIRFLGSLRRLVSRSQECDNVYEANAASGMAVHDDCKLKFLELKAKRTYRFIVFKIEEKQKQVVVEKLGEPSQSYDDFTASLPADECRYAVYDFDFVSGHIKGEKQDDLRELKGQVQERVRRYSSRAAGNRSHRDGTRCHKKPCQLNRSLREAWVFEFFSAFAFSEMLIGLREAVMST
ncbi:hypothetical protein Goari_001784 [Gossypium aridum]|uniref:ADF-H domain-containing protein n=1 Tax=Gossypium aridum TaxID=34290 RepID=A0A7J8YKS9_GOSAI|nr:hypothetical protein [Gossypium aridum]